MTWLFSHIPVIALSVWGSRHANLPATLLALAISLTIPGMTLGWVPVPVQVLEILSSGIDAPLVGICLGNLILAVSRRRYQKNAV